MSRDLWDDIIQPEPPEVVKAETLSSAATKHAEGTTLAEARADVFVGLDDGVVCPCCDKFAKRYRVKINSTIAAWLVVLVRVCSVDGVGSVHARVPSAAVVGAGASAVGYAYLEHWGLIEQDPGPEAAEGARPGRNGHWRPTPKGVAFVLGEVSVPYRVVLYNGNAEGFEGPATNIKMALGDRFDWEELMAARPLPQPKERT